MTNLDTFKLRIKERCALTGISQKFLCDSIGKQKTYLNDAWRGKTTISDNDFQCIADILQTTPEYLKGETDDSSVPGISIDHLRHAFNSIFIDDTMGIDERNAMGGALSVFTKLMRDPEKLEIISHLVELDVETLLKVEQIIDMIKGERS
jgi:transcriptional regulator with XRE-family HTH domain